MLEKDGTKKTIFLDSLTPAPPVFAEFSLEQRKYVQGAVLGCQRHVTAVQKVRLSKLQFALHQRLSLPGDADERNCGRLAGRAEKV